MTKGMAYEQLCLLLRSMLYGAVLFFCYDLWKWLVRHLLQRIVLREFCFMLFWIAGGIGAFVFALKENQGELRGFYMAGWILGMGIYRAALWIFQKKYGTKVQELLKKIRKIVKIKQERRWRNGTKEK